MWSIGSLDPSLHVHLWDFKLEGKGHFYNLGCEGEIHAFKEIFDSGGASMVYCLDHLYGHQCGYLLQGARFFGFHPCQRDGGCSLHS